jgi:hypothetical protein
MGRGATLAELHVDRGDASSIAAALADVEHHHQQRARQYPAPQYPGASIPGMEQGKVKHSCRKSHKTGLDLHAERGMRTPSAGTTAAAAMHVGGAARAMQNRLNEDEPTYEQCVCACLGRTRRDLHSDEAGAAARRVVAMGTPNLLISTPPSRRPHSTPPLRQEHMPRYTDV